MSRSMTLGVLLVVASVATAAHAELGEPRDADIRFEAAGPAGLRIVGKTSAVELAERQGTVALAVPLASIDTGISLRNRHMREHLDAAHFPRAELLVARAAVEPQGTGSREGEASATFRVHGKERPVVLHFHTERAGSGLRVDGSFRIDLRDYDVRVPSYLGATVKPDILVHGRFVVSEL